MVYHIFFKRVFDIILSAIGLVLSLPLLLACIILLYLFNNKEIFFFQERPGLNEIIFTLFKFKTMNDKKDLEGKLLSDKERITPLGSFIRKTSLDELPQLINVLKGDMSLIGPRPLLIEYLDLYNDFQKKRHKVRPGITGLAQVNGRNLLSWEKKFEYDVFYVENMSLLLDLKIFIKTIFKVFQREGISSKTAATVENFKGNV